MAGEGDSNEAPDAQSSGGPNEESQEPPLAEVDVDLAKALRVPQDCVEKLSPVKEEPPKPPAAEPVASDLNERIRQLELLGISTCSPGVPRLQVEKAKILRAQKQKRKADELQGGGGAKSVC